MCTNPSGYLQQAKSQIVREVGNAVDRYAVIVLKNDEIVGHLPKKDFYTALLVKET